MSVITGDRPDADRRILRFVAFAVIVVLAVSGLTARLFYLQITHVEQFTEQATLNRTVQQAIPSTRGLIYDRAGRPLVVNEPSYAVKIRPADLPNSKRDAVVAELAKVLRMDAADINSAIDSNPGSRYDLVRVAQGVARDKGKFLAEESASLPGVEVSVETQRRYLNGTLMAQILGYTGPVDARELETLREAGYLPDDLIGKMGVEATYEEHLRGNYGLETIERDAAGRQVQVLETNEQPVPGDSLRLTIDTKEQKLLERAVKWGMAKAGLKRAVMIVENPQTGEILAMVSLPTYDNNKFARGISSKEYKKLVNNPNKPLLNHAINEQYPPGSTYKLVTGLGALADGRIGQTEAIQTHPYIQIGLTKFWDWNRAGFGALTIRTGFAHSSDTFFYQVAQRLGIERLAYWARQLGFGRPTGIDLPNEVGGIVPSNKWKQDAYGSEILPGEVLQAGIGQGYDVVTPLQILNAYASVANGGKLYRPQVVREIIGPDGSVVRKFKPKLIHRLKAPADDIEIMRVAARQVVTSRHTFNLVELPLVVAGKTGTAEYGTRDSQGRLPFHNWFVGWVPAHGDAAKHDSKLAVIAFAYDSNTVGNVATEMVKYYLQLHYHLKVDKRLPYLLRKGNFYGGN